MERPERMERSELCRRLGSVWMVRVERAIGMVCTQRMVRIKRVEWMETAGIQCCCPVLASGLDRLGKYASGLD